MLGEFFTRRDASFPSYIGKKMIEIEIADEQELLEIPEERIRDAVRAVLKIDSVENAEMSIALVNDETIHGINRQFLGHDYPTDVISFPLSDSPEKLEGEIVLSTDTASREAKKVEGVWDVEKEVLLYIIHGTLHLIGFDDHEEEDLTVMRSAEVECLRAIGVEPPCGLHDRDGEEGA